MKDILKDLDLTTIPDPTRPSTIAFEFYGYTIHVR